MQLTNYIASDDILGIQTNSKYIGWSFGKPETPVSEEEIKRCKTVVRLIVDPLKDEAKKMEGRQQYHYWKGSSGTDELFYQRNFFAGTKLRMLIRGIKTDRPEIRVNKHFIKHIKWRFNNLHSPGYILTDLICAMLLQKELCALHCSAFNIGDSTVAVIAPGNTGKTLTTMRAVFDAEANYMSEDLAIVDRQNLYSCPWTSTFRYYDELSMSWILRWRMKLIKFFPPAELIPCPVKRQRNIDYYISKDRILPKKKITHLAMLARCDGGIRVLEKEEAKTMLFNLNRYEFFYMKSPMLTAYSYFNPEFDIFQLEQKEREILSDLVDNTTPLLVQSKDPTQFAKLILDKIKQ